MRFACVLGIIFVLLVSPLLMAAGPGKTWVRVEGKIESIDPLEKQIVVYNMTIQVTQETIIVMEGEEITFDDLEVDMTVRATGVMEKDLMIARHIRVKGECVEVEGKIASIDPVAMQIVVDDLTIQVTATTIIKMKTTVIKFEDLKVGMTVKACGEMDGGVLVAKKICVRYGGTT